MLSGPGFGADNLFPSSYRQRMTGDGGQSYPTRQATHHRHDTNAHPTCAMSVDLSSGVGATNRQVANHRPMRSLWALGRTPCPYLHTVRDRGAATLASPSLSFARCFMMDTRIPGGGGVPREIVCLRRPRRPRNGEKRHHIGQAPPARSISIIRSMYTPLRGVPAPGLVLPADGAVPPSRPPPE